MKSGLLALIFLAMLGCARNIQHDQLTTIPLAQKPDVPGTEAACKAADQFWIEQGLPGGDKSCAVKTSDGLKICTDSTQCEGACLVADAVPVGTQAIGSCSIWMATYGCHKYIKDGLVREMCAD